MTAVTSHGASSNGSGDAARILVVDDEPGILDVIGMALRYQGMTVETAATALTCRPQGT